LLLRQRRILTANTLVHKLLADRKLRFSLDTFWSTRCCEYRGTGFIDDGRRQVTSLFAALYDNKPFDKFVRNSSAQSKVRKVLSKGSVGGVVNASQKREVHPDSHRFFGANSRGAADSFIDD
jgi:hypothetical protein